MKKTILVIAIVIIIAIILLMLSSTKNQQGEQMKITSSAFQEGGNIPNKYTCNGEEKSPPLEFSDVPEGTQQLVLIMDDPDAVPIAGKVWDHWILFNLKPIDSISEDSIPEGARQGINGAGKPSYQGPCPPPGPAHHYHFKLYALETSAFLLEDGASRAEVEAAMKDHVLAEAEMVALFAKAK